MLTYPIKTREVVNESGNVTENTTSKTQNDIRENKLKKS